MLQGGGESALLELYTSGRMLQSVGNQLYENLTLQEECFRGGGGGRCQFYENGTLQEKCSKKSGICFMRTAYCRKNTSGEGISFMRDENFRKNAPRVVKAA